MSDEFKETVEGAQDAVTAAAEEAKAAAEVKLEAVGDAAKDAAEAVGDAAKDAAEAVAEGAETVADAGKSAVDEVFTEAQRMGNQVADKAKTLWESDQRREMQDTVVKGLTGIAATIEEQVKKIADKDDTKRVMGKLEEASDKIVDQVRSSKTLQEAAETVMKGLSAAAASIERWLGQQGSAPADRSESVEEVTIMHAPVEPMPPVPPVEVIMPVEPPPAPPVEPNDPSI